MDQITEPKMSVTCADILELVEAWETLVGIDYVGDKLTLKEYMDKIKSHDYIRRVAVKKLARYIRQTMSN